MAYQIIRVEALDHNIWRRIMLPGDIDTKERADAALEQYLASYEHYGKDPDLARWWASDKDGRHFELWIEAVA
jgi:hypothetical protein